MQGERAERDAAAQQRGKRESEAEGSPLRKDALCQGFARTRALATGPPQRNEPRSGDGASPLPKVAVLLAPLSRAVLTETMSNGHCVTPPQPDTSQRVGRPALTRRRPRHGRGVQGVPRKRRKEKTWGTRLPARLIRTLVGHFGDARKIKPTDRKSQTRSVSTPRSFPGPAEGRCGGAGSAGLRAPRAQRRRDLPRTRALNDARGAGMPGTAAEPTAPARPSAAAGPGERLRGRKAGRAAWSQCRESASEPGRLRAARGGQASTSTPPPRGEAAAAHSATARPGRNGAARHSPVTPPPSPPPGASWAVCCRRPLPSHAGPGTQLRRRPVTLSPDSAPPPGSLMTRTSGVARSPSLAPRTGRRKSRPGCRKSRPRQPHFPADRSSARLNARTAGSHASPHAAGSALGVEYLPRRRKSCAGPALRRKSGLGLRSSPEVPSLSPRCLGLSRRGILKLLAAQVEM